jgi:mersacidin/lichenicidin family type 2 lantibiotic
MSHENIIRAWKDEKYRQSLNQEDLARLPEHPSGLVELSSNDLSVVAGGKGVFTRIPCSAIDACPSALICTHRVSCH